MEEEKLTTTVTDPQGISTWLPKIEDLRLSSSYDGGPFHGDVIDKARTKFAICAEKGIEYLTKHKLLDNRPGDIADFLLHCRFLDKNRIGEKYKEVLDGYLSSLSFAGLNLEAALRRFLRRFKLPGEAQRIDRLMETFAKHYCQCNPDVFAHSDTAYILSFSIILLNTDLHSPHNPNRMTKELFMSNVRGIDNGADLPIDLLSAIYDGIAKQELMNDQEELIDYTLSAPDIEGTLWKKSDRSNFYSWNRRWCVVANGCLYYFYSKRDKSPRGVIPLEDLTVRPLNRKGKFRFEVTAASSPSSDGLRLQDEGGQLSVLSGTIRTQNTIDSVFAMSIDGREISSGASIRSHRSSHPSLPLIKSAKFVKGQLVEGKRDRYIFQCANEGERDRWVSTLNGRMQKLTLQVNIEHHVIPDSPTTVAHPPSPGHVELATKYAGFPN